LNDDEDYDEVQDDDYDMPGNEHEEESRLSQQIATCQSKTQNGNHAGQVHEPKARNPYSKKFSRPKKDHVYTENLVG
jgi:hypothetical protein